MSQELILYALWDEDRQRYFVDSLEAKSCEALPLKAIEICRIDREDRELMTDWAIDRARRGWPPEKMKRICEGVCRPWKPLNR